MESKGHLVKDLFLSFGLTGMLFMGTPFGRGKWYFDYILDLRPNRIDLLLFLALFTGITLFFWALTRLLRKIHPSSISRLLIAVGVGLILTVPLNFVRKELQLTREAIPFVLGAMALTIIVGGYLFYRFELLRRWGFRALIALVACFVPFSGWVYFQAVNGLFHQKEQRVSAWKQDTALKKAPVRVLWMVFDELDIRVAFEQRSSWIACPCLDEWQKEMLYFSHAQAAGQNTLESLPSMLIGKKVRTMKALTPWDATLIEENGKERLWNLTPSIFSRVEALGFGTGCVGFYHPYSYLVGKNCTFVLPTAEAPLSLIDDLKRSLFKSVLQVGNSIPFLGLLWLDTTMRETRRAIRDSFLHMQKHAFSVVADPRLEFLFIHWPVPHPPGIFDAKTGQWNLEKNATYTDNLSLVDQTLKEVQARLQAAGLWDSTVVIITADHPYRQFWKENFLFPVSLEERSIIKDPEERVPLLIKLAGQKEAKVFDGVFSTVYLSDLVLSLFQGENKTVEDVEKWCEELLRNKMID